MNFKERYKYDPQKDLLGKGGFSRVYKAYDMMLQRDVALKFFTSDASNKYDVLEEIRRVIRFQHPNLVQYYDVQTLEVPSVHGGMEKSNVGILEFVNGGDLYNFIKTRPSEQDIKEVVLGILRGLQFIHSQRIIHRDIKPQNILMHREGGKWIAKIADFGISKKMDAQDAASSSLVGTVEYMAPEQFNPMRFGIKGSISTNVDLWAFGVILYEIFSGEPFFGRRSSGMPSETIMSNIVEKSVPHLYRNVKEPYETIIRQCLVKDADLRVQDASELIEILEKGVTPARATQQRKIAAEQPKPTPGKAPVYQQPKTSPKAPVKFEEEEGVSKLIWIIPLVLLVTGVIGFAIYMLLPRQSGEEVVAKSDNTEVITKNEAQIKPVEEVSNENSADEKRFKQYMDAGEEKLKSGDLAMAETYFNNAEEIKPNDSYLQLKLKEVQLRKEQAGKKRSAAETEELRIYDEAVSSGKIEEFENYLRLYPGGLKEKQAQKAINNIREDQLRAETVKTLVEEGDKLMGAGKYSEAKDKYVEAARNATEEEEGAITPKIEACNNEILKQEAEANAKKENKKTSGNEIKVSDHRKKMELLLLKSDKGVVRGLNFNLTANDVSKIEKGNGLIGDSKKNSIEITTDESKETAEIKYKYFEGAGGKLKDIQITTRQNSEASVNELYKLIQMRIVDFTGKRGTPDVNLLWENNLDPASSKQFNIELGKSETGITITYYIPK